MLRWWSLCDFLSLFWKKVDIQLSRIRVLLMSLSCLVKQDRRTAIRNWSVSHWWSTCDFDIFSEWNRVMYNYTKLIHVSLMNIMWRLTCLVEPDRRPTVLRGSVSHWQVPCDFDLFRETRLSPKYSVDQCLSDVNHMTCDMFWWNKIAIQQYTVRISGAFLHFRSVKLKMTAAQQYSVDPCLTYGP